MTVSLYNRYGAFLNHPTLSQVLTPGVVQSHTVSSPLYHLRSPGLPGLQNLLFGDYTPGRQAGIFYDEDASLNYSYHAASSPTDYAIIYTETQTSGNGS